MKSNIIEAPAGFIIHPDLGVGANPAGLICAANEARFTSANYSEPLTAYTVGWRDPESLDVILEDLFPSISIGRRFEFKKADNAEAFLSELDDIRAIGAPFKRVETKGTTVNEKTHNKGLTMRVDHDDTLEDNWREQKVAYLLNRILRNDLRRSLITLNAAATNEGKVWGAAANPDKDIRDTLTLGANATGIRPNVVLYSEGAQDLRLDVYEAQDTPYAGRAASMTPEQMAAKYMVDKVRISKSRYQTGVATKGRIMTDLTVLLYLAIAGSQKDDPTNVKRFVTPTDAGRWKVYVVEHEKFTDVTVEHYSNTVITASAGIRKITASAA